MFRPQRSGKTAPCSIVADRRGIQRCSARSVREGGRVRRWPVRLGSKRRSRSRSSSACRRSTSIRTWSTSTGGSRRRCLRRRSIAAFRPSSLLTPVDAFAEPRNSAATFTELRCTFAGRSIIPDVVCLARRSTLRSTRTARSLNPTLRPPDIHVEIVSPDQSVQKCREQSRFFPRERLPARMADRPGT